MSSIGGILNTARNAIYAHQTAVQVASHNIANAATEGYSRQRAELQVGVPQLTPQGSMGTGVLVRDVSRMRDQLADVSVRRETGKAAGYTLRRDVLAEVEGVFGEPSEIGIASTLDRFWNSWADLANQPTSPSARGMVRQRGEQVAGALNHAATRLGEITEDLRSRVGTAVSEVNRIAKQIADLNVEVVRAEAGGRTAGDMRDTRDRLIDELSGIVTTRVIERGDGSVAVQADGIDLVDANAHRTLTTAFDGSTLTVRAGRDAVHLPREGSKLGEMVRLFNEDLPAVRRELDTLARGIVTAVNDLHREGKTDAGDALAGKPAGWDPAVDASLVDFFEPGADPSAIHAGNIALSAAVRADASVIAARRPAAVPPAPAQSGNQLALDIGALRDSTATMPSGAGTTSFDGYYRASITRVAQDVDSAENSTTVYESLAALAQNRRESVSGVSTDEELIRLMQSQQAYIAATRLVSAVDEMTQSLLSMV